MQSLHDLILSDYDELVGLLRMRLFPHNPYKYELSPEDLLNETIMKMISSAQQSEKSRTYLRAAILKRAENLFLRHIRKTKNRDKAEELYMASKDRKTRPVDILEFEMHELCEDARLDPEYRLLNEGYSLQAISEKLGISRYEVSQRIGRLGKIVYRHRSRRYEYG